MEEEEDDHSDRGVYCTLSTSILCFNLHIESINFLIINLFTVIRVPLLDADEENDADEFIFQAMQMEFTENSPDPNQNQTEDHINDLLKTARANKNKMKQMMSIIAFNFDFLLVFCLRFFLSNIFECLRLDNSDSGQFTSYYVTD